MLGDDRESREQEVEDLEVVVADDRGVAADPPPRVLKVADRDEGVGGVPEDERRGAGLQVLVELDEPPRAGVVRADDARRPLCEQRGGGPLEGGQALAPRGGAQDPGDVGDRAVPVGDQLLNGGRLFSGLMAVLFCADHLRLII